LHAVVSFDSTEVFTDNIYKNPTMMQVIKYIFYFFAVKTVANENSDFLGVWIIGCISLTKGRGTFCYRYMRFFWWIDAYTLSNCRCHVSVYISKHINNLLANRFTFYISKVKVKCFHYLLFLNGGHAVPKHSWLAEEIKE